MVIISRREVYEQELERAYICLYEEEIEMARTWDRGTKRQNQLQKDIDIIQALIARLDPPKEIKGDIKPSIDLTNYITIPLA